MRVITFYSFKGGVGRTMALMNVAAGLIERGRRLLLVDFDLEAPGIQTYSPFANDVNQKGVVDYVTDYLRTNEAPNVHEYLRQYSFAGGSVSLMPAGLQDKNYASRLNSIEWLKLYSDYNGYLMFEDLKQQWAALGFEYVLIDSRTGHTDIAGICTRQLPNAVVLMFLPNDQNINGLQNVVHDIRLEAEEPRNKNIFLHFCPSNVPDLDDEELILQRHLNDAQKRLKYHQASSVIHHYNNLALLDQAIFVEARPTTKLANEYRTLTDAIVAENLEDKDGALAKLEEIRTSLRVSRETQDLAEIEATLGAIYKFHNDNGEVAWSLSLVYEMLSDVEAQRETLDIAIRKQVNEARARTKRAQILLRDANSAMGRDDLRHVLSSKDATTTDLVASIERLGEIDPEWIAAVQSSDVLERLNEPALDRVLTTLITSQAGAAFVADYFGSRRRDDSKTEAVRGDLVLALIGTGQFSEAKDMLGTQKSIMSASTIADVFNFACAEWGERGTPPTNLFARALQLAEKPKPRYGDEPKSRYGDDPNFIQCMSMAEFICGNKDSAFQTLDAASKALEHMPPRLIFSCWRYLYVKRGEFRQDIEEMRQAMTSGNLIPRYMQQPSLLVS